MHVATDVVLDKPALPLELWGQVFRNISSPSDLRAAARICRSVREEAEQLLYTSVSLDCEAAVFRFCATISTCPRRASSVRSLDIRIRSSHSDLHAIRLLTLLKDLSLDLRNDAKQGEPCESHQVYLAEYSFPTLRTFSTSIRPCSAITNFLMRHPQVEDIALSGHPTNQYLDGPIDQAEPLLLRPPIRRTIECSFLTARVRIARQLPVTHLYIKGYCEPELPIIARLFGKQLISLRLAFPSRVCGIEPTQWSLGYVATWFPRLCCLGLDDAMEVPLVAFDHHGVD
ncbi:hypothetical protein C8Q76DRAFT_799260 [Earliella scabrosa]|nr:hypothetical protein C8Q76DRAFT_799260 [Earliella scabrosa]